MKIELQDFQHDEDRDAAMFNMLWVKGLQEPGMKGDRTTCAIGSTVFECKTISIKLRATWTWRF